MDAEHRADAERAEAGERVNRSALFATSVVGFGLSALLDVFVFHHVLQWHHLLSGIYPMDTLGGLRTNILADGVLSLVMLTVLLLGAGLLWRAERRSVTPLALRPLAGTAIVGVGIFDAFDAVVDHALLGLHQPLSRGGRFNPHWLAVSLLLVALGYYVYRSGVRSERTRSADTGHKRP